MKHAQNSLAACCVFGLSELPGAPERFEQGWNGEGLGQTLHIGIGKGNAISVLVELHHSLVILCHKTTDYFGRNILHCELCLSFNNVEAGLSCLGTDPLPETLGRVQRC